MLRRFKVTKTPSAAGEIEVAIQEGMDIRVIKTYVTLPRLLTYTLARDVRIRKPDGTVLGIEKAHYKTSEAIGLVFENEFMLPKISPKIVVDTATVVQAATGDITIECVYEEIK